MHHYTYLIRNFELGLFYIGLRSSRCPPEVDTKYMGSSPHLKAVMKQHASGWQKEILSTHKTRGGASNMEELLIAKWMLSHDACANRRGGGANWRAMSHKTKSSISTTLTGRVFTDEHRANISKANTGRPCSEVVKAKLSKRWKGSTRPEVSAALIGKPRPDKSVLFKGIAKSPEQKQKMAEARRLWWERKRATDPNYQLPRKAKHG